MMFVECLALSFHKMTAVIVPKFNFIDMLKDIERYRVNMLSYDILSTPLLPWGFNWNSPSLVPPHVVMLCKV